MKQLTALWTFLLTSLSLTSKETIIDKGKLNLSESQESKLKEDLGSDDLFDQAIKALNTALAAEEQESATEAELQAIKTELAQFNSKIKNQVEDDTTNGNPPSASDDVKNLLKAFESQEAKIEKLMKDSVEDTPLEIIKGGHGVQHSATHLFASGKSWDEFEGRNWNKLKAGITTQGTDFNNRTNIKYIKEDIENFLIDHPDTLESLFWENTELPAQWSRVGGVADMRGSGFIIPSEVTQGRKPHWAPKGAFDLPVEAGKVWAKQVDLTFKGYELQKIQNTWLNKAYNKQGSHPWKWTFVYFLLSEIFKQVKLDSKNAMIKGVFVETPDGRTGMNLNSQPGLLYHYWQYRDVEKKYRPAQIGSPTQVGIIDYVDKLIKSLPEEKRKMNGLELQLSQSWLDAYRIEAGKEYQLTMLTEEGRTIYMKNHPLNYDNIIFQPVFTNTDFMAITLSKNVEIMFYDNAEKEKITFTEEKRDLHGFMDFREGIRLTYVGKKLVDGDPREFDVQAVWSNAVPIFENDYYAPLFDDTTKIASMDFTHYKVDEQFVNNIESVENVVPGVVYMITSNSQIVGTPNLVDGNNLDLTSNFSLKTGGTIVLLGQSDFSLKEITRIEDQSVEPSVINFDSTAIDADEGSDFLFSGTSATTLSEILNGVGGQQVTITGTAAAALTVAGAGINLTGAAVLDADGDTLTLVKVNDEWYEVSRAIA